MPRPMTGVQQLTISETEGDQRLDRWFKKHFPEINHGRLEKLLRTGQVRLDGKRAKAGDRVAAGQIVRVPPIAAAQDADRSQGSKGSASKPKPVSERDAKTLRDAVLYK